ncbi:4-hydroxy-tetrahydrodipicolinate synthase [Terribacillus sp. 179-K 1B1 HS]|uniref:4-hydroxy-tetrahydrodipicolinate synthase n=1 Tax=Terribacillus sp. 179-K 1B1 HS TaxID=3142388 RepID=UPI0039A0C851
MKLAGIWPAMVTAFDEEQHVSENNLKQLTDHLIGEGVHGLFILGTNGEFHTLTTEEKLLVARTVMEAADNRVPVMVGTGGNSTKEVIDLSLQMKDLGADALSIITPYFIPITQEELAEHYEYIADAIEMPIMLYNIPSKTGMHIEPETVERLADHPYIIGIKDSSGKFGNIQAYIDVTKGKDFAVFAGTDSLILQTLQAGGKGAVAATANVLPKTVLDIYRHAQEDTAAAEAAQKSLQPLRDTFAYGTIPSSLKKAIQIKGFQVGDPRLPVKPVSEEALRKIENMMEQYKMGL